jgi:hypothetical protein
MRWGGLAVHRDVAREVPEEDRIVMDEVIAFDPPERPGELSDKYIVLVRLDDR